MSKINSSSSIQMTVSSMATALTMSQHRAQRRLMLALLFLGIMIVAADKAIFAFAGVTIMSDLNLSPAQFGLLGSAFFMLYSVSGVAVGFVANRIATRWVLLGLALIWATCQIGVAFSSSLGALIVFRILLGVGAGPSSAIIQHSCFKWFHPNQRTFPASIINSGLMAGILISALSLPWLIQHYGWRSAYLVLAVISLLWLFIWALIGREGHVQVDNNSTDCAVIKSNQYRDLLLNRTFIVTTALTFIGYMISGLSFSWHPTYLQKGLGLSAMQSGLVIMCVMVLVIALVLSLSAYSQRLVNRGIPMRKALVWLPVFCCLVGGVGLCLMGLHSLSVSAKLLISGAAFVLLNIQQNFGLVVCGGICQPSQRGSLLAIHLALTTSAGIVAPMLAGQMVAAANNVVGVGYENCLSLIGVLVLIASLFSWCLVDPERTRLQLAALAH